MKEDRFKERISTELKNQEDEFFKNKNGDKNQVWTNIETEIHNKRKIISLFWYVAASVAIFLFVGLGVYYSMHNKNKQIANLQQQLELKDVVTLIDTLRVKDTVYISDKNRKTKYKKHIMYDTVFITETTYDTIFITEYVKVTDTVYANEPVLIAENNILFYDSTAYNLKRKFKKQKQSKFKFILFTNNNKKNNTEHKNLLTFNLK